ncbi:MAG TPA: hypothetical protein VG870_13080 [Chitinophagaceae bacterium]|nr:hypothetical protein [Chitinophagaceae bacterium]
MKTFSTLSIATLTTWLLVTGCSKQPIVDYGEGYWLAQDRGVVVYSSSYCYYYVVQTNYGYTVIGSVDGYRPFEGDVIYGNFSNYGVRDYYDRSSGVITSGNVREYWLSYADAQQAITYYCH